MANPLYVVGREIGAVSLSLNMWHTFTAGIDLFLIVLSRDSSKRQMFETILRKYLSLL